MIKKKSNFNTHREILLAFKCDFHLVLLLRILHSCISFLELPKELAANLVASNNGNLIVRVLKARSPKSRCQQGCFPLKVLSVPVS